MAELDTKMDKRSKNGKKKWYLTSKERNLVQGLANIKKRKIEKQSNKQNCLQSQIKNPPPKNLSQFSLEWGKQKEPPQPTSQRKTRKFMIGEIHDRWVARKSLKQNQHKIHKINLESNSLMRLAKGKLCSHAIPSSLKP